MLFFKKKKTMHNLFGSIRNYGLLEGLSLYIQLKNFQIDGIETSKLQYKVHLRPGSTDNCVFKQIFLKQDFNIPILDNIQIQTALDLGANVGMASLFFAHRFPYAKIVGVEPDESNGEMFRRNLHHYPGVEFILGAVWGDYENLVVKDYGKGASGYVTERSSTGEGMSSITISDIMERYHWDNIDILKMDIEGSEKSVFEKNYENWLPKTKILFVELHEQKAPGCSKVFNDAIDKYNFEWSRSGEYEVLINRDLV